MGEWTTPSKASAREKALDKATAIAREIRAEERANHQLIHFNELVRRTTKRGLATRVTVSTALAKLQAQGVVEGNWTKTNDGRHIRELKITAAHLRRIDALLDNISHPLLPDAFKQSMQRMTKALSAT